MNKIMERKMAGLRFANSYLSDNVRNWSEYTLGLSPRALYMKVYRDGRSDGLTVAYGEPRWDEKDFVLFEIYSEVLYDLELERDRELAYLITFKDINNNTHVLSEGSMLQQKDKKMFSQVLLSSFVARNYNNDYFETDTISQRNIITNEIRVNYKPSENIELGKRIKTTVKGTYLGTKNGSFFSYNP